MHSATELHGEPIIGSKERVNVSGTGQGRKARYVHAAGPPKKIDSTFLNDEDHKNEVSCRRRCVRA